MIIILLILLIIGIVIMLLSLPHYKDSHIFGGAKKRKKNRKKKKKKKKKKKGKKKGKGSGSSAPSTSASDFAIDFSSINKRDPNSLFNYLTKMNSTEYATFEEFEKNHNNTINKFINFIATESKHNIKYELEGIHRHFVQNNTDNPTEVDNSLITLFKKYYNKDSDSLFNDFIKNHFDKIIEEYKKILLKEILQHLKRIYNQNHQNLQFGDFGDLDNDKYNELNSKIDKLTDKIKKIEEEVHEFKLKIRTLFMSSSISQINLELFDDCIENIFNILKCYENINQSNIDEIKKHIISLNTDKLSKLDIELGEILFVHNKIKEKNELLFEKYKLYIDKFSLYGDGDDYEYHQDTNFLNMLKKYEIVIGKSIGEESTQYDGIKDNIDCIKMPTYFFSDGKLNNNLSSLVSDDNLLEISKNLLYMFLSYIYNIFIKNRDKLPPDKSPSSENFLYLVISKIITDNSLYIKYEICDYFIIYYINIINTSDNKPYKILSENQKNNIFLLQYIILLRYFYPTLNISKGLDLDKDKFFKKIIEIY